MQILKTHFSAIELKRFDEKEEMLEASFQVTCDDFSQLEVGRSELRKLGRDVRITFLDNKGIM